MVLLSLPPLYHNMSGINSVLNGYKLVDVAQRLGKKVKVTFTGHQRQFSGRLTNR